MPGRPMSQDQYPHRVARVRSLVAGEQDGALVEELVDLAVHNEDVWRYDGAAVRMAVEVLPPSRRHALILAVADRAAAGAPPVEVSSLLRWLARGLGPAALSWRAGRCLIDTTAASVTGLPDELRVLAEVAVRETGAVPPELLAVIRRSAMRFSDWATALQPWLDTAADPLNVGEAWAGTANAEVADRPLLVHALAAKGAHPAAGWARRAAAVAGELGAARCRTLIHRWFDLVPRPRTLRLRDDDRYDANEVLDPHNALALRGLLFLLTTVPPDPEDPAVVGRLAQHAAEKGPGHGPRSKVVAYAAVHTLERLGTVPALHELQRLRSGTNQPGFSGRLDVAIARRRAALRTSALIA
ncbi:hypothetical protein ACFO1B_16380 [Dactylosporangium siamense]|uniref:Uncharacterized protein n=1 Tax=Dactylosporangium siamense TaxID=685454 RepID=A0A919PK37_9ACTN|nr:hypothetical protein [Dactylosporangium siamense]GIG45419.1 hypothetical protein Dsi01nite_034600 [Dactylosporangium siamense]